ncbi:MAG TPA: DUF2520 domain-containing protein [Gaiellaceae bacterium]|nr:DUF2520 domain-containing protein [Gaiellaceae bacterium]
MEFTSACVVGPGRVGTAVAARLSESMPTRLTGRELEIGDADFVLLCVPDRAVHEVAAAIPVGAWIAHTSGARTLDALDPHRRRFSLHPLQTIVRHRGPEQLDGAWAAVNGEGEEAIAAALRLAGLLRVRPFVLDDEDRLVYHAGAVMAQGFLVALHRAASELFEQAGAPPEALFPLMRRTMENDFELTGPATRGDWETIERHLEVIRERRPELEPMYRALTDMMTAAVAAR